MVIKSFLPKIELLSFFLFPFAACPQEKIRKTSFFVKILIALSVGYLFFLLIATSSNLNSNTNQWISLSIKYLYLFYLYRFFPVLMIRPILNIYSNIILLISIFCILCTFLIFINLPMIDNYRTYLAYLFDFGSEIIPNIDLYRIRGFTDEPGTFGFIILSALYYFIFINPKILQIVILTICLVLTMSFGAALFLFLLIILLLSAIHSYNLRARFYKKIILLFSMIFFAISALYILSELAYFKKYSCICEEAQRIQDHNLYKKCLEQSYTMTESQSSTAHGKIKSFGYRINGIELASKYLISHPMGAGASQGIIDLKNSIAVGFVIAIIDAGIFGGAFYLVFFAALFFKACSIMLFCLRTDNTRNLPFIFALSTLTVLFMGLQRIQSDMSFWHMWIYACMLILLQSSSYKIKSVR